MARWALLLATLAAARAEAQQGDFEKKLLEDAASCAAICLQDKDLLLFGGTVVVPFERPSVEKCGEWMSTPAEGRTAKMAELRRESEKLAARDRYSAVERQRLRQMTGDAERRCEQEFKRRCEEARKTVPLEKRKAALLTVEKGVENVLKLEDQAAIRRYLKNVLASCPLDQ